MSNLKHRRQFIFNSLWLCRHRNLQLLKMHTSILILSCKMRKRERLTRPITVTLAMMIDLSGGRKLSNCLPSLSSHNSHTSLIILAQKRVPPLQALCQFGMKTRSRPTRICCPYMVKIGPDYKKVFLIRRLDRSKTTGWTTIRSSI